MARRLLLAVPTLLGLSLLVFALVSLAPGDPAEQLAQRTAVGGQASFEDIARVRTQLGLDDPFVTQYLRWLKGAVRGDLGRSFSLNTSVSGEIWRRLPATAALAVSALTLTLCLAVPLGAAAAMLHRSAADHLLRVGALVAASVPGFFLAYILIAILAVRLHLVPVAGRQGPSSLLMPTLVLAAGPTARVSRLLRSSLLEVLSEDYMRTAAAKGLSRLRVVVDHGLRNAAIPSVTVLGGVLGELLEGAVIAEVIFAWPGVGRLTFDAIGALDYPMIQGTVLFAGVVFVLINLSVDVSYTLLDPRIRLGGAA